MLFTVGSLDAAPSSVGRSSGRYTMGSDLRPGLIPKIRIATSDSDRESVFRLRYREYVERMGRTQEHADHGRRRVEEPMDAEGTILGAFLGGRAVGTVRWNWVDDPKASHYTEHYGLQDLPSLRVFPATITTKLMVSHDRSDRLLGARLCRAAYISASRLGAVIDFIDCNAHMERWFSRLGYRQIRPDFHHPEYGLVTPMVLAIGDIAHLTSVGSPFADLADESELGTAAAREVSRHAEALLATQDHLRRARSG